MLDALQEYAHVMGYTRAEALAAWPDFWSRHGSFLQATMLVAWQNAISNAVAQEVKSCRKDTSVLATYLQTNSAKETARLTGVPISTVYYKIQQAKRRGGF
jgi:DNA-directed RNA polymerase specialized sigma24 family protein